MKPLDLYPLMGTPLGADNSLVLDLSTSNTLLSKEVYEKDLPFQEFLSLRLKASGKRFAIGGYLEKRVIYSRSKVFASGESIFRSIHLGVDIWTETGSPVFCPLAGKVHSFNDNPGFGNYGPTLILEHQLHGKNIYSLFGHLSRIDMGGWQEGAVVEKGTLVGHLGAWEENGCWPPHLHFQLIKDIGSYRGDFPGVCEEKHLAEFKNNCPNPNIWLNSPLLE